MRRLTLCATCSSRWRTRPHSRVLSGSPCAMRPVSARRRAMRPSEDFLRPFSWLPPRIKRVASAVPSLVWIVHTARESLALNLTEHTFTSGAPVTCSFTVPGLEKFFSTKVCSHQRLPRCTNCGLFTSQSSGSWRPSIRTFTQHQLVPVQSLSKMPVAVRCFHIPAYNVTDLFQRPGGAGGRFLHFLPLAKACSFSLCHLARLEWKEWAAPNAA